MARSDAQREVRVAVEASGLTRKDFAEKIGIDPGTLADFIEGKRWAQGPKRTKMEDGIGWPAGTISRLERGETLAGILQGQPDAAAFVTKLGADSPGLDEAPGLVAELDRVKQEVRELRQDVSSVAAAVERIERRLDGT